MEPGSSGSPLLDLDGNLAGLLTGAPALQDGESYCDLEPFYAAYSRFSSAYPTLKPFLYVNGAPEFSVSPASISLTISNGVLTGANQAIVITTKSNSLVPFTIQPADSWLAPNSAVTGSVAADAPVNQGVGAYDYWLTLNGTYHSSFTITVGTGTPVVVPVTLTISNTQSNVILNVNDADPFREIAAVPTANGNQWIFAVNLTETNGIGTTLTAFRAGGIDYSNLIPSLFGGASIAPSQSLDAVVRLPADNGIPSSVFPVPIEFDGADPSTGTPWTRTLSATFDGLLDAGIVMIGMPQVVRPSPSTPDCPYPQHVIVQALGTVPVTLTFLYDFATAYPPVAATLGSTYIPPGGALQSDTCHADQANGNLTGKDPAGTNLIAYFTPVIYPAAPGYAKLNVSPAAVTLKSPGATSGALSIDPGAPSLAWTAAIVYDQQSTNWLAVTPTAGSGAATLSITANPSGLTSGLYTASIVMQSNDSTPQYQAIPVSLQVTASGLVLVNGASFSWGAAPGAVVSLFDADMPLATGTEAASSIPLPLSLQGTSVTVNTVPAPLYYVSAGQLNVQIPYETAPGNATIKVQNSAGQSATQEIFINAVAPGIFLADGKHIAPDTPVQAGQYATLFLSGQGYVSPPVATGAAPPDPTQITVAQLPMPLANIAVYVNGVPAEVAFSGIPFYLAGVTQVNFVVPAGTPAGDQPLVVTAANLASNTAYIRIAP